MPWAMSYLLGDYKYLGPYWPPNGQDVINQLRGSDPNNSTTNYWRKPLNPSDPGPWTIGNYWQYTYELKVLGTFSSRRVMMWPENLVNYPPFGNVKVATPSYGTHSYMGINVYNGPTPIYITPLENPWGPRARVVSLIGYNIHSH